MLLLAVKGITESNRKFLSQYDVTVVTPDTITAQQIPEIVISYAWDDAIGQKILANPNSKLKWIQTQSAGVDYLPLKKLKDFGVVVTNASGLKAIPIAQTVLSYILYFARGLNIYTSRTHWEPYTNQYLVTELPVLVFGTGRIGQQIASHIKAFGGTVYGVNTTGHMVAGFDEVYSMHDYQKALAKSRVVVDGLPGTPETDNFFNNHFFDQVNQLFLFINIGRGTTLNQNDLLAAIDDSRVKYAALDVTTPEPLPKNHPLFDRPQVLLTQHTSWGEYVNAGRTGGLFRLFEKNVPSFVKSGTIQYNIVNLDKGY
ncbi:phosphoglycerate dehydrogenase [Leuconostoc gelidum subsp. aenigmaticum]|uniref:NAD(P)-dependent oxidoreductase n=1 Tax=Leuconostoc gelidum TaxID=1244 RepID=UPI001C7D5CB4|nr:NAD(P)-dependent oxidoreductase [Leuconostoc gelidum]MBZ6002922.1 phosphoglycerate dehydrogenase [Leuconostoc gelidum subsp. aenigmaticum]MBZ6008401.1 phosphoglycerate dehydrogenase [Leuconostoc gelidum subsp. aenigmaticum]MBZ6010738.1 phosphoglycerate dehydrogenase [Leuconostoc gelidum subsp. aenigmaticum]